MIWAAGRNRHGKVTVFSKGKRVKRIYKNYLGSEKYDWQLSYSKRQLKKPVFIHSAFTNSQLITYTTGFGSITLLPPKENQEKELGLIINKWFTSLDKVKPGTFVYNLNKTFAKAAGTGCLVIGRNKNNEIIVRLPSKKVILLNKDTVCQLGKVYVRDIQRSSPLAWKLKRLKGLKSRVNGLTKNPIDHPNGGSSSSKVHKNRWGNLAK